MEDRYSGTVEPMLVSFNDTPWTEPCLRADKIPTPDNRHGIYCVAEIPQSGQLNSEYFSNAAYGEIELFGTIIEHESGYRAEMAIVKSLVVCEEKGYWPWRHDYSVKQFVSSLEHKYQCPVASTSTEGVPVLEENHALVNAMGRIAKIRLHNIQIESARVYHHFPVYNHKNQMHVPIPGTKELRWTLEGTEV